MTYYVPTGKVPPPESTDPIDRLQAHLLAACREADDLIGICERLERERDDARRMLVDLLAASRYMQETADDRTIAGRALD